MGVVQDTEVRELVQVLLAEAVAVGIAEGAWLGSEDVSANVLWPLPRVAAERIAGLGLSGSSG